jgi:Tol biopolymer transport system component
MARPFDPETLKFRGDPVSIAISVGSFNAANAGLFSVSQTGVLVYRTGVAGLYRLTWRDAQGKTIETLGEPGLFFNIALSPHDTRVAYAQTDSAGNRHIFVLDVARGRTTQITFDAHRDDFPVWSPDETRIAFASNRSGHMDLYEHNADGSGEDRPLYRSDQDKTPTSWWGEFLLFDSQDPKMQEDIWVLPLSGERKPRAFLRTTAREREGSFSRDGRWIAYETRASGQPEILIQPFTPNPVEGAAPNTGDTYAGSKGGGLFARWSWDMKKLLYINQNGQLMTVDIEAGKSVQAGSATRLLNTQSQSRYSVASDGKRFLLALQPPSTTPITVVVDWRDGLKK